jgi:serine/threonine protein kinase
MSPWSTHFSPSATILRLQGQDGEYGFIAALALAQWLHIDFLPLTWQTALDMLGEGGQARINQASIDADTSFAFKRFGDQQLCSNVCTSFQDIMSEMIVLSHPLIQKHPYIVQLEGICWDIPDDGQVWPVLVFQKANPGDLYQFLTSGKGQSLPFEDRLELCTDIGIAVKDMHYNSMNPHVNAIIWADLTADIIHGDIKPQNVLIFEDETDHFTAKVADFGFSTMFRGDQDYVSMPRSTPWYAQNTIAGSSRR